MGDLEAQSSPQSSKDTADDRLDKILVPLFYIGGGLDDYGAPTENDIKSDPVFIEAKAALASYLAEQEAAIRINELKKWRTMVQRLSAYVDSPDSLIEFDERIAELEAELARLQKGQHGA